MTLRKVLKINPDWLDSVCWIPPYKTKPKYWKSLKTGNEFPYGNEEKSGYTNQGYGGVKKWKGIPLEDLPKR